MGFVICEKLFNRQQSQKDLRILPQSLGQLSGKQTLANSLAKD
jgi:hypothetical protein